MKVMIDTNVLISAILRDRDPETVLPFKLEKLRMKTAKATA
jgi:predicted nucleic acid-binding protein